MKHNYWLLTISGLVILAAITGAIKVLGGPATATIINPAPRALVNRFNLRPVTVTNQYASFNYPAAFTDTALPASPYPTLVNYMYIYKDTRTWQLSVTITALGRPDLSADNSYQFRLSQPANYTQSQASFGANKYVIMTDRQASGFSQVAYLQRGMQAAEIMLSGDDPAGTANLQASFTQVLTSFSWH